MTFLESLKKVRDEYESIAACWNGEDAQFMANGISYHEEDAQYATDVMEKCDELITLLSEES